MKHVCVCVWFCVASFGCWYGATIDDAAHIRPGMLEFAYSSRLSPDDDQHIHELMAVGAFDEIERFFRAYAARLGAKDDPFSQAFADDARRDADRARDAGLRWREHQKDLKRYRDACGIPEPLPLPEYCR